MKGTARYIITRPCLSEGSVRLLKYLDALFPQEGPVTVIDDRGAEHHARVDRRTGRVLGLGSLFTSHNLGVNDVLLITALAEGRYQVECVVKPHAPSAPAPRPPVQRPVQRVVVSESAYVREIRTERVPAPTPAPAKAPAAEAAPAPAAPAPAAPAPVAPAPVAPSAPSGRALGRPATAPVAPAGTAVATAPITAAPVAPAPARPTEPAKPAPTAPRPATPEALVRDLAALTGYRVEVPREGVLRLRADLGQQSYSVAVALSPAAPAGWREGSDFAAVVVPEHERPEGVARLTLEAVAVLLESARLAPLTPLELRGYWNAGGFDLDSAASVAELVSAQLSTRGVFSFVLMTLAQQPAHSVVSQARLAERLGSGVNPAELARVLDTLSHAPFGALSPLGGGQYYLRAEVTEVLRSLAEYAEGLRSRVGAELRLVANTR